MGTVLYEVTSEPEFVRKQARRYLVSCAVAAVAFPGIAIYARSNGWRFVAAVSLISAGVGVLAALVIHIPNYLRCAKASWQRAHGMALILTTDELVVERYAWGCRTIKLAQIEKVDLRPSRKVVVTLREKGPLGLFKRKREIHVTHLDLVKARKLLGQLRQRLEHLEWQS